MLISINNSIPSVCLHLGTPEYDENRMRMLVDTESVMNTDNLLYNQWVISQCPDKVEEYLQYGQDMEYDVLYLPVAPDFSEVTTDMNHG